MRKWIALLSVALTVTNVPITSYGDWLLQGSQWIYEDNQVQENNTWRLIDGTWYYFDENGYMAVGWKQISDKWYFFNPVSDGSKGTMLTGWQWIDGYCYYLAGSTDINYPSGAMYENTLTPDGFLVNSSGAWTSKDGTVQYQAGKGIQTAIKTKTASASKFSSGGSGGGGGSGGSKSGTKTGSSEKPEDTSEEETKEETATPSDAQQPGDPDDVQEPELFGYTIKYLDIEDKAVLKLVTGKDAEDAEIVIDDPEFDGYEICSGQKDQFRLVTDGMTVNIYYSKTEPASPSEAKKVSWKLYFVEQDNHSNEIFKSQSGQTEEDKELVVDFPETILGTDQYYYHSLVSSPWSIIVNGTGTQKYYIEYEKGEKLPEETDIDQEAKEELENWIEISREADLAITGGESSDQQLITESLAESNERLLNLASMADGVDRKEVYVIAKNHTPTTVILSQKIKNLKNISQLIRAELTIDGDTYMVMRVGFEKTYEESTCSHSYEVIDRVEPSCMNNGHETVYCTKCGKEETVILPATGHIDTEQDGVCDICYQSADETPETVHYSVGDVQARTIRNKTYLFRCIDEDYEDANENSQKTALFLCDSVIRSDIMGTSKKLNFGDNNNYKYSKIREWLQNNASDSLFLNDTYIGITRSYIGSTGKNTYEQLNESSLMGFERLYQSMEDKIFILSVEEALKYRDYLWTFNGSETNNPDSQISAYSKGYYLRTPQDGGLTDFWYGDGIYAVSLTDGNIKPVNVSETSIGIRPAMTVPQG